MVPSGVESERFGGIADGEVGYPAVERIHRVSCAGLWGRHAVPCAGCGAFGGVRGMSLFFFQAEDGIRDLTVTGVQTCALPIFQLDGDAVQGFDLLQYAAALRARVYRVLYHWRDDWSVPGGARDRCSRARYLLRDRKSVV